MVELKLALAEDGDWRGHSDAAAGDLALPPKAAVPLRTARRRL